MASSRRRSGPHRQRSRKSAAVGTPCTPGQRLVGHQLADREVVLLPWQIQRNRSNIHRDGEPETGAPSSAGSAAAVKRSCDHRFRAPTADQHPLAQLVQLPRHPGTKAGRGRPPTRQVRRASGPAGVSEPAPCVHSWTCNWSGAVEESPWPTRLAAADHQG